MIATRILKHTNYHRFTIKWPNELISVDFMQELATLLQKAPVLNGRNHLLMNISELICFGRIQQQ